MHALLNADGLFLGFDHASSQLCHLVPSAVGADKSLAYFDPSAGLVLAQKDGEQPLILFNSRDITWVAPQESGNGSSQSYAISLLLDRDQNASGVFDLVESDVANDIVSFCRDRWVVVATRQLLDFRSSIVIGRSIQSNGFKISIDSFPFHDAKRHDAVAMDIIVVRDGWKVDRLRRYRPAVVMVQFSDNELSRRMIKVLTESLVEIGEFDGDLLVIGDQDRSFHDAVVHPALQANLMLERREATGGLQVCLMRWTLSDVEALTGYQPVLYVDTDVVCDGLLEATLIELACADRVSAQVEFFNRASEAESCGSMLFEKDPMPLEGELGICSGLVGLPNLFALGRAVRLVPIAAAAYVKEHGLHSLLWNDQPVFNYVVRKLCIFEEGAVGRAVAIPQFADEVVLAERRGFVHFWRAGSGAKRADEMERYLRRLVEAKAAGQLPALHGN